MALLFKVKDEVSVLSAADGSDLRTVSSIVLTGGVVQLWGRGLPHSGVPCCSGEAVYPRDNHFLKRGSKMGSPTI